MFFTLERSKVDAYLKIDKVKQKVGFDSVRKKMVLELIAVGALGYAAARRARTAYRRTVNQMQGQGGYSRNSGHQSGSQYQRSGYSSQSNRYSSGRHRSRY